MFRYCFTSYYITFNFLQHSQGSLSLFLSPKERSNPLFQAWHLELVSISLSVKKVWAKWEKECVYSKRKIEIRQKQTQMCVKKWCVFFIERKRERDNVCVCVRVCVCVFERGKERSNIKRRRGNVYNFLLPFSSLKLYAIVSFHPLHYTLQKLFLSVGRDT